MFPLRGINFLLARCQELYLKLIEIVIFGLSDFDFGTWSTDINRIVAFSKKLEKEGFSVFSQET